MTVKNPSSQSNWPIGWTVVHVAETGSTNDDLLAAAHAGAADQTVIVADFQTAGKGRLDRSWEATRGTNLLVSLLFRYGDREPSRYTRIVALAARAACQTVAGVQPVIKWPNDLVVGGHKLAGLLAVGAPRERFVVVGIGVNVGWAPSGATSLAAAAGGARPVSPNVSPLVLLGEMLREIDRRADIDDAMLHAEHKAALVTLGARVRVELRAGGDDNDGGDIVGVAVDLDELSRLVVRDDAGTSHVIEVGDVVHLRAV
jgi:BirA family biotin operon repressor/biotin-[acetyl-CoA-carboxylase] ligase